MMTERERNEGRDVYVHDFLWMLALVFGVPWIWYFMDGDMDYGKVIN